MKQFFKISKSHYLQYVRSYAFLITLIFALYAAYTFAPAADAGYRTIRIGNFIGVNNSAWAGYRTAMMSSIYISIIGFFLINSNIKRDVDTGVGMIISTTSITNLYYLLTKACSNFMVLISITGVIMLMSMTTFILRPGIYPFEPGQFIFPFLFITMPSLFFIAAMAVVAEVFFHRFSTLMNIGFLILMMMAMAVVINVQTHFELFGVKGILIEMQRSLPKTIGGLPPAVSMGFIFSKKNNFTTFTFQGIHWSGAYLVSRLLWMCAGFLFVIVSSRFFHRFDLNPIVNKQKRSPSKVLVTEVFQVKDIKLSLLPRIMPSFGIIPLIKTEFLLLFRKGPKWLWLLNLAGMVALIFLPLTIAHQFILPTLWFLQIGRWSDSSSKEKANNIHYFSYTSYKPLSRLFSAQVISGALLSLVLGSPLIIRYFFKMQFFDAGIIFIGAVFISLTAFCLGLLSGGKKLFEVLFFLCFYTNMNRIPFTDYFGGVNHSITYLIGMFITTIWLGLFSFLWRYMEMKRI